MFLGIVGESVEMMYSVLASLPAAEGLVLPKRPTPPPVGVDATPEAVAAATAAAEAFEAALAELWAARQLTLKAAMEAIEVRDARDRLIMIC